jgi:hypothetical protein
MGYTLRDKVVGVFVHFRTPFNSLYFSSVDILAVSGAAFLLHCALKVVLLLWNFMFPLFLFALLFHYCLSNSNLLTLLHLVYSWFFVLTHN